MKTETAQEQLKRIGDELTAIGFERVRCEMTPAGQQKWEELWARGQELYKQYCKLKEKIDAQSASALASAIQTSA